MTSFQDPDCKSAGHHMNFYTLSWTRTLSWKFRKSDGAIPPMHAIWFRSPSHTINLSSGVLQASCDYDSHLSTEGVEAANKSLLLASKGLAHCSMVQNTMQEWWGWGQLWNFAVIKQIWISPDFSACNVHFDFSLFHVGGKSLLRSVCHGWSMMAWGSQSGWNNGRSWQQNSSSYQIFNWHLFLVTLFDVEWRIDRMTNCVRIFARHSVGQLRRPMMIDGMQPV